MALALLMNNTNKWILNIVHTTLQNTPQYPHMPIFGYKKWRHTMSKQGSGKYAHKEKVTKATTEHWE